MHGYVVNISVAAERRNIIHALHCSERVRGYLYFVGVAVLFDEIRFQYGICLSLFVRENILSHLVDGIFRLVAGVVARIYVHIDVLVRLVLLIEGYG